jgi:hypothetical protein
MQKSAQQYADLLHSFQASLSQKSNGLVICDVMTVVSLGLYEIVSSSESHPFEHVAHVRGVSAILLDENSPFDFLTGIQLFQLANPLVLKQPSTVTWAHGKSSQIH